MLQKRPYNTFEINIMTLLEAMPYDTFKGVIQGIMTRFRPLASVSESRSP